jgi:hypothetical protein
MATNKLQRGAVGALVVGCGLAAGLAAYFASSAGQDATSDGAVAGTRGRTPSTPEPQTAEAPDAEERRPIDELQPVEGDVAPLAPTAEVSSQPPNTTDTPAAPAFPSEDEIARMSGSELRRLAERLLAEHEVEIDAEIERRFSLAQYDYVIPQGDPQPTFFGKVVGRGDEHALRIVEIHRVRDARFYDKRRRAFELQQLARTRP